MFHCKHSLQDNRRGTEECILRVWKNRVRQTTYVSSRETLRFGEVDNVSLVTSDAGLPRGVGFVHFESVADAVSFVETNEVDPIFVLDRQLHVEHSQKTRGVSKPVEPSDTLMVLNFRGQSEVEVRELFGSHADNILAVRFSKSHISFVFPPWLWVLNTCLRHRQKGGRPTVEKSFHPVP